MRYAVSFRLYLSGIFIMVVEVQFKGLLYQHRGVYFFFKLSFKKVSLDGVILITRTVMSESAELAFGYVSCPPGVLAALKMKVGIP